MQKLRGRFDGQHVVLDDPVPASLRPDTVVQVVIPEPREAALAEWQAFSQAFWSRPLPPDVQPQARNWRRDELYERGSTLS